MHRLAPLRLSEKKEVKGFTKIFGNQVGIYHQVKEEAEKS